MGLLQQEEISEPCPIAGVPDIGLNPVNQTWCTSNILRHSGDTDGENLADLHEHYFKSRSIKGHDFDGSQPMVPGSLVGCPTKSPLDPLHKTHFVYMWLGKPGIDWGHCWLHDLDFHNWELFNQTTCPICNCAKRSEETELKPGQEVCSCVCEKSKHTTHFMLFFRDHNISHEALTHQELNYIHHLLNFRYKTQTAEVRDVGWNPVKTCMSNFRSDCTNEDIIRFLTISKWINTQENQAQNKWPMT